MIIKNVKVINPDKTIKNCDIIIKDNKIKEIIKKEGQGSRIVVPGFIDTHVHGMIGLDAMDSKEAVEKISQKISSFGVTSFLPTLMTASDEKLKEALKNASLAKSLGAKIEGLHLEGPFISFEKKGAHDPNYLQKGKKEKLNEYYQVSKGKLKKLTFAPEVVENGFLENLIEKNIIGSIGHSMASKELASRYFKNGAKTCTHLWNAMSGKVHEDEGIVGSILAGDSEYAEFITDFIHSQKERVKKYIDKVGINKITIISDSIRPAGLSDGYYKSGGLDVEKHGIKITLKKEGNIAGSGSNLHDMFKKLLSLGYNYNQVVKMTSTNSAKLLGLEKNGYIKKDFLADLVILDEANEIIKVLVEGKEIILKGE